MPEIFQISRFRSFDRTYRQAVREFYHKSKPLGNDGPRYYAHHQRLQLLGIKELLERVKQAGINPHENSINIGVEKGKPVFIELNPEALDPKKVRTFMKRDEIEKETSRSVLKLLARYEKLKEDESDAISFRHPFNV